MLENQSSRILREIAPQIFSELRNRRLIIFHSKEREMPLKIIKNDRSNTMAFDASDKKSSPVEQQLLSLGYAFHVISGDDISLFCKLYNKVTSPLQCFLT